MLLNDYFSACEVELVKKRMYLFFFSPMKPMYDICVFWHLFQREHTEHVLALCVENGRIWRVSLSDSHRICKGLGPLIKHLPICLQHCCVLLRQAGSSVGSPHVRNTLQAVNTLLHHRIIHRASRASVVQLSIFIQ